ncbi:MAG: TolB family protein [Paludibacteraceae bacterium]
MKKILLIFFVAVAHFGMAQQVKVLSLDKVTETKNGEYYHPQISSNGEFLLLTKADYRGLVLFNLADKSAKILNHDAGAGYGAQISDDGSSVLYKKINLVQNRRQNALIVQNIKTGDKKVLIAPTREPITQRFIDSQPAYVKGKQMVIATPKATSSQRVITIEDRRMVIYTNGNRKEMLPNGKDASYIWPGISPDGRYIAYTVAGKGTFVCSIDGKNVKSLGKLNAPRWAGNRHLVGMNDIDDGEKLISSTVLVVSIDGKVKQQLNTPSGVNAMYPDASKDGSKVVFSTDKGEIYIANVELK